jgi:hypothetical protein
MANGRVVLSRGSLLVCALQKQIRLIRYVRVEQVIHIRFMYHSLMVEF